MVPRDSSLLESSHLGSGWSAFFVSLCFPPKPAFRILICTDENSFPTLPPFPPSPEWCSVLNKPCPEDAYSCEISSCVSLQHTYKFSDLLGALYLAPALPLSPKSCKHHGFTPISTGKHLQVLVACFFEASQTKHTALCPAHPSIECVFILWSS